MKIKKTDAECTIRTLAKQEGISVEYIRSQIKIAMDSGLCNSDPQVQANWKKIPCKGDIPTPEELIDYLAIHVNAGTDPFV